MGGGGGGNDRNFVAIGELLFASLRLAWVGLGNELCWVIDVIELENKKECSK